MQRHFHETPKPPCASDSAWEEAERAAFRTLCEATGHVAGTDAFLGDFNGLANAFFFNNDTVDFDGNVFYAQGPGSFEMGYTALVVMTARAAVQRWAMRVMQALPVCGVGNIEHFRLAANAFGQIQQVNLNFGSEDAPAEAWQMEARFDLVIRTR